MTRVLIAFDKFKDALTAHQACETAATVLRLKHPDWQLDLCPLTDGGEGFCETLTQSAHGRIEVMSCTGPRGDAIEAPIGYVHARNIAAPVHEKLALAPDATLAVIEMASASGLALLVPAQRDPWHTSSRGTGEQIQAAAKRGVDAILVGIGGSATNDLGFGALAGLGVKFFGENETPVDHPTPATWETLSRIEGQISLPPLFIACDVTNPLLGPNGTVATFGPQKGLRADDAPRLEQHVDRLSTLLANTYEKAPTLRALPGTGAAGGFAFGLMVAADAKTVSGSALVADWLNLPARIRAADIVITGEGRFDVTSLDGKGPGAIISSALQHGKAIHVFAGTVDLADDFAQATVHAISPPTLPLTEALKRAEEFLIKTVAAAF